MLDVAKQLTRIQKYLSSLNSFLYLKLVSIEKNTLLYVVLPSFNIILLIFFFMSFFLYNFGFSFFLTCRGDFISNKANHNDASSSSNIGCPSNKL